VSAADHHVAAERSRAAERGAAGDGYCSGGTGLIAIDDQRAAVLDRGRAFVIVGPVGKSDGGVVDDEIGIPCGTRDLAGDGERTVR